MELFWYTLISMVLGATIAHLKEDYATRGAAISLFGGIFAPVCMLLAPPSKRKRDDVWPENAPIGVIINILILFAIFSVSGRILLGLLLLALFVNIFSALILETAFSKIANIQFSYKNSYITSFIVFISANIFWYIGYFLFANNIHIWISSTISLIAFMIYFIIWAKIFSSVKDPTTKLKIGFKKGAGVFFVYQFVKFVIIWIPFVLIQPRFTNFIAMLNL